MVDKLMTTMVLKVDLQCRRCYNKVKKVLCKFPQIQDQVYDEKKNTVTIKVVCCCPEKIKKKIICKGGEAIKDIEIVEPEKKKEPDGNKPDDQDTEKNQQSQKPPEPDGNKPSGTDQPEKNSGSEKPPDTGKSRNEEGQRPDSPPDRCVPDGYWLPQLPCDGRPVRTCCEECYGGRGGGPCWRGQQPPWPFGQPYYDGYCGARPMCNDEYYVVQYECHRENYGPCRIM